MKKFISLLSIAMVMLSSCSNDESFTSDPNTLNSNTNGTVLKKIVANINGGTIVTTGEYIYDGNKLAKILSDDGKYSTYTYTGNLITQIEFYSNGILSTKEIMEYNANNQLTNFKRVNAADKVVYRAVYVYNSDRTISVTGYKGELTDQNSEISSKKVFFENGQVSKIETYINGNGSNTTETATYTFDTKNTPFKNILGFDKLTYFDSALNGNNNNTLATKFTSSANANSDTDSILYTYNALGYPATSSEANPATNGGKSTVFQYFYE